MGILFCCRRAYGSWIHFINLIIYVIFLALLTVLVTTCTYQLAKTNAQTVNVATNSNMTTTYETTETTMEAKSTETITVRSCEVNYYLFNFCFL